MGEAGEHTHLEGLQRKITMLLTVHQWICDNIDQIMEAE